MDRKFTKDIKHRVITLLDRKELDFLDKLAKDALFSTGHKLSYNEILRSLIDFMMEIGLSGEKVDSQEALRKRILEQIKFADSSSLYFSPNTARKNSCSFKKGGVR